MEVRALYTKRTATCAGVAVDTGLEIRVQYSGGLIISTQLFRGSDACEVMDAHAALTLEDLLRKGYVEETLCAMTLRSK